MSRNPRSVTIARGLLRLTAPCPREKPGVEGEGHRGALSFGALAISDRDVLVIGRAARRCRTFGERADSQEYRCRGIPDVRRMRYCE